MCQIEKNLLLFYIVKMVMCSYTVEGVARQVDLPWDVDRQDAQRCVYLQKSREHKPF